MACATTSVSNLNRGRTQNPQTFWLTEWSPVLQLNRNASHWPTPGKHQLSGLKYKPWAKPVNSANGNHLVCVLVLKLVQLPRNKPPGRVTVASRMTYHLGVVYASLTAYSSDIFKTFDCLYFCSSHGSSSDICLFIGTVIGVEATILLSLSNGFVSSALSLIIGVLYDRLHSRVLKYYGWYFPDLWCFLDENVVLFEIRPNAPPETFMHVATKRRETSEYWTAS